MPLRKGQKGVISGREAARRAQVAQRKVNFRAAKDKKSGAAAEVMRDGKKPTGR